MNCARLRISKKEKLRAIRVLIWSVFIVATAVTINSVGWTPVLAIIMGLLLLGEHKLNGEYRAKKRAKKARQKNARRSAIHTSKVIPINKLSNNKVTENRRAVK